MICAFKAKNHPAQVAARGAIDEVDDRGTDPVFFEATSRRFGGFTLDAAASGRSAKCDTYFTRADDGLSKLWAGRVWCNPPFSACGQWVQKAWEEWKAQRVDLIAMLLPANRVEQPWWQDGVEPFRDRLDSPLRVEFLRGRMRFERPSATIGPKGDRPPFGCCLLIWTAPRDSQAGRREEDL